MERIKNPTLAAVAALMVSSPKMIYGKAVSGYEGRITEVRERGGKCQERFLATGRWARIVEAWRFQTT